MISIPDLPTVFMYYVPGYLAFFVFTRLTRLKNNEDTFKADGSSFVPSIVISFVCVTISQLITDNQTIIILLSIGFAIVLSILFYLLWRWKKTQDVFKKITHTTVHKSIWDDALVEGTAKPIRIFTDFNHKEASIEGVVKYYEVDKDGDCRIVLSDCTVNYTEGKPYKPKGSIMFKAEDIQIIEIDE